MNDGGTSVNEGSPGRGDHGLGFDRDFVVREIAETGALERGLLEKYDRVAVAYPCLDAAVAADLDRFARDDIHQLITGRVAVTIAKLDREVIRVATLVVKDADCVRAVVASLHPRHGVAFDLNGLAEVRKVFGVLTSHKTAEEVKLSEKLVECGILVEAYLPECRTVVERFDITGQMLFLAVHNDGNTV